MCDKEEKSKNLIRICFRLSSDELQKIEKFAEKAGTNRSAVIRKLIQAA